MASAGQVRRGLRLSGNAGLDSAPETRALHKSTHFCRMASLWAAAQELAPQLVAWRRYLHANPELSFEEKETQRFVWQQLERIGGFALQAKGGTGVVADLCLAEEGPWVALRADMDALPIEELAERPYRSQRKGIMHACGHDAHTAMLLGAAALMAQHRPQKGGGIRFIFQPGEERAPGGASLLLQEGVLSERPVQAIWALHVTPQLPVGQVGLRAGPFMAASDELYITLRGPGGHAAYPHQTPDPIVVGAMLVTELQAVVSRAADPRSPTVLTIGRFQAGHAPNIIPTEAHLAGTLRTFAEAWRAEAKSRIQTLIAQKAQAWGLTAEVHFASGYPVLINDPALTARTRAWLEELFSPAAIQELPLWMSSEDFAFYSQVVPACFIRLGTAGPNPHTQQMVHTPTFDIDERALPLGAAVLAHVALRALAAGG